MKSLRMELLRSFVYAFILVLVSMYSYARPSDTIQTSQNSRIDSSHTPQYLGFWQYIECGPWSCVPVGTTCRAIRGVCGWSWDIGCLTKLQVYDCTRICQKVDAAGNVLETWEEQDTQYTHIGCCNICVMRQRSSVNTPSSHSCLPVR